METTGPFSDLDIGSPLIKFNLVLEPHLAHAEIIKFIHQYNK